MKRFLHTRRSTRAERGGVRWVGMALLALLACVSEASPQEEPALLDAHAHPKFVNLLPNPLTPGFIFQSDAILPGPAGDEEYYRIGIFQIRQSLGLVDAAGTPLLTSVYGYGKDAAGATYPGRTFLAQRDRPVNVLWANGLVDDLGQPLPHLLPVDTTLHWAEPMAPPYPASGVPVVTHLHGGHSESASDGLPEAWFTPGFTQTGRDWKKEIYHYDLDQRSATLWYHDHALGITRLNVYAGLAGFFILRDATDTGQPGNPLGLPAYPYEVPIVIQDRMFTAEGQLFYPSEPEESGQPSPSILPEFFGDFILVNGQAWPVVDVEPRKYRLRFLNGSDSRFYNMWLAPPAMTTFGAGPPIHQIGTDTGLLYAPVAMSQLTLGPGERADTIVDFAGFAGVTLVLRNNARAPFPKGDTVDPQTVGQLMAFRVGATVTVPDSPLPMTLLPAPIERPGPVASVRQLVLFEGEDGYGRLLPQLGTLADGALRWDDPITENPMLDDVEIWEIFNATPDAHPIHLHLVSFQILSRQKFRAHVSQDGRLSNVRAYRRRQPPDPNEAGWKDTVQTFPGEVTHVIAKFDREGLYVWHCHILSHEDHEMMRPYCIGAFGNCMSPMP